MEALGIGLEAIGSAIGAIAGWSAAVCIVGIIAVSVLIYNESITLDDLKQLFKKDRRY